MILLNGKLEGLADRLRFPAAPRTDCQVSTRIYPLHFLAAASTECQLLLWASHCAHHGPQEMSVSDSLITLALRPDSALPSSPDHRHKFFFIARDADSPRPA
jgi:hypothetical protein